MLFAALQFHSQTPKSEQCHIGKTNYVYRAYKTSTNINNQLVNEYWEIDIGPCIIYKVFDKRYITLIIVAILWKGPQQGKTLKPLSIPVKALNKWFL